MKITRIAPSILSADFTRLGEEVRAAEAAGADMLHVDIMDGHFVPNITIGPLVVEALRKTTRLPLDVHLMVEEPERFMADFVKAGADYLTVHMEACVHLHRIVHWIKENGVKAGVSLNPATSVWTLEHILLDLDLILLMSVNPGFGGQTFIPQVMDKIRTVKCMLAERALPALLEVDGGVKYENAKALADAGADILVMGSAFFHSTDYGELILKLKKVLGD